MKLHNHKILAISTFIMLLTIGAFTAMLYVFPSSGTTTSALTYSSNTDISFTFAPKLSISLSDTSLVIDTLVPGQTSTSNAITITVGSNTPHGYALYADVGSNDTSSKYYNTSDLIRDDNINSAFTSIAVNASLTTLDTDNTWGYSTSLGNGTTWSTYNGLPVANASSPIALIDTNLPADSQSITLKVAARSSATQASGTYGNIINFYAVGKPAPPTIDDIAYMQEFTASPDSIKASMAEHVTYTLKDARDDREYTVAKLKDGKVWMTQNLDLAGGTRLYSETSDVPEGYYYVLPNSSDSGWSSDASDYVYNVPYFQEKRTACSSTQPCFSYYSWTAATALSGKNIASSNIDAPYSICPKGWKLPTSRTVTAADWQAADFYRLAISYGMTQGITQESSANFYHLAGPDTIPNFLLAGWYESGLGFTAGGWGGYYWSSTSSTFSPSTYGSAFFFRTDYIGSAGGKHRKNGQPVRCLAR